MALKKQVSNSRVGNVVFPNAYFRIVNFPLSRKRGGGTAFMVDVSVYAEQPETEDVQEINFLRYHGDVADLPGGAGQNPIDRAYAWLKLQPELSGAVDV